MCANYCDTVSSNITNSYFITYQAVFCLMTAQTPTKSVVCDSFLFVSYYQTGNGFATESPRNTTIFCFFATWQGSVM